MSLNMAQVFGDKSFSLMSMSEAMSRIPYIPTMLEKDKVFTVGEGLTTNVVGIEFDNGKLTLVPNHAWGEAPRPLNSSGTRKLITLAVSHLQATDGVSAADIMGVRDISDPKMLETIANRIAAKQIEHRRNFDLTLEWQRVRALNGVTLDSDGTSVLLNHFTAFGVSEVTITIDMTLAVSLKSTLDTATAQMQSILGGMPMTGITCYCSDGLWAKLNSLAEVRNAYQHSSNPDFLRQSQQLTGFEYCGWTFKNYTGGIGGTPYIPANIGRAIPNGTVGVFETRYAPADLLETVNTIGLPFYTQKIVRPDNRGLTLDMQSNPINIVKIPQCLFKVVTSA